MSAPGRACQARGGAGGQLTHIHTLLFNSHPLISNFQLITVISGSFAAAPPPRRHTSLPDPKPRVAASVRLLRPLFSPPGPLPHPIISCESAPTTIRTPPRPLARRRRHRLVRCVLHPPVHAKYPWQDVLACDVSFTGRLHFPRLCDLFFFVFFSRHNDILMISFNANWGPGFELWSNGCWLAAVLPPTR